MSRFSEMEAFVAVVESGSFSAAAKRLNIAVSAVSRRIGELESRLGTRLANRSTRGFAPTAVGQNYYQRCLRIMSDIAEADAEVSGKHTTNIGVVRIAAPLSFGMRHLGKVIHSYAATRPQLKFEIDLSDRQIDIIEEGYDFAIRIGRLQDSSLIAKRLFTVRRIIAASPEFWQEHGKPEAVEDLETLPALCYRQGSDNQIHHYKDANGQTGQVRLTPRYLVNNGEFTTEGALDGLGFILEPSFICGEHIISGKLEQALNEISWASFDAYAIWPPGRPLPSRAKQLIDHIAEIYSKNLPWEIDRSC